MARILLIEDDLDFARYVQLALADEGMDVVHCADGTLGLTAAPVTDPGEVLGAVPFDGVDPCVDGYSWGWWGW